MPRGVYDRSKAKPRTHTAGRYRKRKIMTDVVTTEATPEKPESFLDDLTEQLAKRQAQIKDEINAIDNQMTTMTDQRINLLAEQDLISAGLKALEAK